MKLKIKPKPKLNPAPKRKPGMKAGLTREKILDAASYFFVDPGGSFQMTTLARKLKVTPHAVYAHFPGRQKEIMSEMVRIALDHTAPPISFGMSGPDYLRELFKNARSLFHNCPGLAKHAGQELVEDPFISLIFAERLLGALNTMGIAPKALPEALRLATSALSGFLTAEFPPITASTADAWVEARQSTIANISGVDYPQLASMKAELRADVKRRAQEALSESVPLGRAERWAALTIREVELMNQAALKA